MDFLVACLILLTAFYLLAILTEHFFVPAIDIISHKLKLSSDAAGATLLAMGSSAPEFFTVLIAVLGLVGEGHADIGAGAVVGSAMFNVLVIVGLSAFLSSVHLVWKIVLRDLLFYCVTIILLLVSFSDGKASLTEAITFVTVFCVYVFSVIRWKHWFNLPPEKPIKYVEPSKRKIALFTERVVGYVVPNPDRWPKAYLITFLASIFGIAGLSWLLIDNIVIIADSLSINPVFLGLTVLAAGTSIPDLIGSVVVARQGRGDMAVSNAFGSNIFDALFGLGVPWLIALAILGDQIAVGKENLFASVLLLFGSVIAILFLLISQRWRLGRKSGFVLIFLYFAYCAYVGIALI